VKSVPFGKTGRRVSIVGLGGEGVLRTVGRAVEARAVIREAIAQGITYFDSARVYSDSEVYYGSVWQQEPALRKTIFQTSKSASRQREGALADLRSSLERLHTDYLDLWQLHDVRTEADLAVISSPGGALEAFVEAKKKGMVRHIGVTGHHDPYVLTRAVEEWPVDSVLLPVNPIEGVLDGFLTHTLAAARRKGIAVIGMKVLGGSHYVLPDYDITPEKLLRYALAKEITLPIVGCSAPKEVQALSAAADMDPFPPAERSLLEAKFASFGPQMAFYRGVR